MQSCRDKQGKKKHTMKCSLVLTVLLSLLVAKLCRGYCIESLEQQMPSGVQTKKNPELYKLPLSLLRRLYGGQGISYEALLRLSGKEEINPQTLASSQKLTFTFGRNMGLYPEMCTVPNALYTSLSNEFRGFHARVRTSKKSARLQETNTN
ncbi:hypothetical protein E2320_016264 [Naja naja]|nr:hypothetical protein E2320_016264 [Naja naja]